MIHDAKFDQNNQLNNKCFQVKCSVGG